MMQPLPNLSQTYALLTQEEKQRECSPGFPGSTSVLDPTLAAALLARTSTYKPNLKT